MPTKTGALWMTFRKKTPDDDGYLVLDGEWTGQLYDYGPVRVPETVDLAAFLAQDPMPSVRPGDAEFAAWVDDDDARMRDLWMLVLLHHPDPAVRHQVLRSGLLDYLHADRVADLLLDPGCGQAAAEAVWHLDDQSVRVVLTIVQSRGMVASGFTPQQTQQALQLLRSTCPERRLDLLEAHVPDTEAPDTEQLAARLVELVGAANRRYDDLTQQQTDQFHDCVYQDRLIDGNGDVPDWLAELVEIRRIGRRLDDAGGWELMHAVATRVGELSPRRMAERHLAHYWDRIGDWLA